MFQLSMKQSTFSYYRDRWFKVSCVSQAVCLIMAEKSKWKTSREDNIQSDKVMPIVLATSLLETLLPVLNIWKYRLHLLINVVCPCVVSGIKTDPISMERYNIILITAYYEAFAFLELSFKKLIKIHVYFGLNY